MPKIKQKRDAGVAFYDIKEYKEKSYNDEELSEIYNKLGKLEDLMEKYGIESIEEVDNLIANYRTSPLLTEEKIKEIAVKEQRRVLKDMVKEICYQEYGDVFTGRDTWKKACELACEEIEICDNYGSETYTMTTNDMLDYFYTQAQKGRNDDNS